MRKMSDSQLKEYIPTIDAILSVADLEQITVKKIRLALQSLFDVDLDQAKKRVNDLILERYHRLIDERERELSKEEDDEEDDLKPSLELLAQKDKELAFRLQQSINKHNLRGISKLSKPKPKAKAKVQRPKSLDHPFMRPLKMSPTLLDFLGVDRSTRMSRPEVVKIMWQYIRDHNLQNPNDKREIISDEKLEPLFGKKQTMFSMNRVLAQHLFKEDE